jgi:hypothetical protein
MKSSSLVSLETTYFFNDYLRGDFFQINIKAPSLTVKIEADIAEQLPLIYLTLDINGNLRDFDKFVCKFMVLNQTFKLFLYLA